METRIVEIEEFKVKGFALKGPLSQIPEKWEKLNSIIEEAGVAAEESFGVCISMNQGEIHYIAGIKSNLADRFSDTEEVVVSGGKYIVASVEGGIPAIPTTFNAIMKMPDIRIRGGYAIERYTHSENTLVIEVWMPIY